MKVIITLGLPASGKSTWAHKYQQENKNVLILNRDSIRIMLGGNWTFQYEELVKNIEYAALNLCLKSQKDITVIIDDTNLNPKTLNSLIRICNENKADIELKSFLDISPLVCIERDSHRINPVGETTIRRMFNQVDKIRTLLHL